MEVWVWLGLFGERVLGRIGLELGVTVDSFFLFVSGVGNEGGFL